RSGASIFRRLWFAPGTNTRSASPGAGEPAPSQGSAILTAQDGVSAASEHSSEQRSRAHVVAIDLERLFRLRAAVGRFGEMDRAGWWNTQGVLGARGAAVYKRGLPETHFFARVRVVTAVAADRSRTVYPAGGVAT